MIQKELVSPTIFNIVVDAVVRTVLYHPSLFTRGVTFNGSKETTHSTVRSYIGNEIREFEGLSKGGNTGKGIRNKKVGKTGEFDKDGVPRGAHLNITGMDEYGANT